MGASMEAEPVTCGIRVIASTIDSLLPVGAVERTKIAWGKLALGVEAVAVTRLEVQGLMDYSIAHQRRAVPNTPAGMEE